MWHQNNCLQRILRVGSFFPPVLQPTQASASKRTTSASWESKRLCIKKVKSPAGSYIDPRSLASRSWQSPPNFVVRGGRPGSTVMASPPSQLQKGVSCQLLKLHTKQKQGCRWTATFLEAQSACLIINEANATR